MESILRVKNFGPIKDAELDLRNVNVLIGPQASGKSTLAKLYTICMSPLLYHSKESDVRISRQFKNNQNFDGKVSVNRFFDALNHYSLVSFYSLDTEIYCDTLTHRLELKNGEIYFEDKFNVEALSINFDKGEFQKVQEQLIELTNKSDNFKLGFFLELFLSRSDNRYLINVPTYAELLAFINSFDAFDPLSKEELYFLIDEAKSFRDKLFSNNAIYVPAERTIINLIKQAALNFQLLKIPIPTHLLEYAAVYEQASLELKELDLKFLKNGAIYKNEGGEDRIFFTNDKSVKLTESASGFQSLVPMLIPIQYLRNINNTIDEVHLSFVIEEPETNLFPKAQYDVLKFLESGRNDDSIGQVDYGSTHTYTTHSPFILTSLNNMLYAWKKGNNASDVIKERISNVLDEQHWIDPKRFSAYEVKDGTAVSIFDRETGLIQESMMDEVSEEVLEDFRKIAVAAKED